MFKIEITPDSEGYILMQCKFCGNYFKLKTEDVYDNGFLNIYCPSCGQHSDDYFTEQVIELTNKKITSEVEKILSNKQHLNSYNFQPCRQMRVYSKIDALKKVDFRCCKKSAKIKMLLKFTGCYCPFCGVKEYEIN